MSATDEVLAAAAHIVTCFGEGRRDDYFACFEPEASFVFYNSNETFPTRAAYESAYDGWERDGWRVTSCVSRGGAVTMPTDDVAIFTHSVATTFAGSDEIFRERETIVFVRRDSWRAVHEHLSPEPGTEG